MTEISRKNGLRIPRKIDIGSSDIVSAEEEIAIKKTIAKANGKHLNVEAAKENRKAREEQWAECDINLPHNVNDLVAITVTKKLSAYIVAVTAKAPAKFRSSFVNRMINLSLDTVENLMRANFLRMDDVKNYSDRQSFQTEAIIKLKMLGYIAFLAENAGCLTKKQFNQISMQTAEAISLTVAWKSSDRDRWRTKSSR